VALLIDTSIFIGLERRSLPAQALDQVLPDDSVALASMTASELLMGVHRADTEQRRTRRSAFVEQILGAFPVLPFGLEAARLHAELACRLMMSGSMIGAHDLIIAATALASGCAVVTDNAREFGRIAELVVYEPSWPPT
jgi:predicted nucleic acid-binding protein